MTDNVDDTFLFAAEVSTVGAAITEAIRDHSPDAVFFALAIEYLKSYPAYVQSVGGNVPGSPVDFLNHIKTNFNKGYKK